MAVAFAMGEQVAPRGMPIGVFALVNELGFQGTEEALPRGIIPAACRATQELQVSASIVN